MHASRACYTNCAGTGAEPPTVVALRSPSRRALACALAAGPATLKPTAEPTLKDVLKAISELDAKVGRKVDELRTEMKKGFADLDKELTGHT